MSQPQNKIETPSEVAEYCREIAFRIQTSGQLQPHLDDLADAMLDWYEDNCFLLPESIGQWPAPPPADSSRSSASSLGEISATSPSIRERTAGS